MISRKHVLPGEIKDQREGRTVIVFFVTQDNVILDLDVSVFISDSWGVFANLYTDGDQRHTRENRACRRPVCEPTVTQIESGGDHRRNRIENPDMNQVWGFTILGGDRHLIQWTRMIH